MISIYVVIFQNKLLYVISLAVRWVKFETKNISKCHVWYLCQKSRTNHTIICLYYYPQKVVIFSCRYFKLSWNTTALSQSNSRNFSWSSINFANENWIGITVGHLFNAGPLIIFLPTDWALIPGKVLIWGWTLDWINAVQYKMQSPLD